MGPGYNADFSLPQVCWLLVVILVAVVTALCYSCIRWNHVPPYWPVIFSVSLRKNRGKMVTTLLCCYPPQFCRWGNTVVQIVPTVTNTLGSKYSNGGFDSLNFSNCVEWFCFGLVWVLYILTDLVVFLILSRVHSLSL